MTTRVQRLAMLGLGALTLTLGVAAAFAFASPGDGSISQRGVAIYELDTLDAAAPLYDERVPVWIVALPGGGYRAFNDDRGQYRCPLRWRSQGESIGFGWAVPAADPGIFQGSCRTYDLFDIRGRPACVVDQTLSRAGHWQHLEEFAASIDEARGLLIVDLDATSRQISVCRYPPGADNSAATTPPRAPPSSPR